MTAAYREVMVGREGNARPSRKAMVFVHGVLSSGRKCFGSLDGTHYWPELVATDQLFDEYRIFVADYESHLNSGPQDFRQAARRLWDRLCCELFAECRDVLFVCHSLGGVVVRKMLSDRRNDIKAANPRLFLALLASPTRGSWLGTIATYTLGLAYAHQLLSDLRIGSRALYDVEQEFRDLLHSGDLNIAGREAHESRFIGKKLPGFIRNRITVVDQLSAGVFFGPSKLILEDHWDIVAPTSCDHDSHLFLRQSLAAFDSVAYRKQLANLEELYKELYCRLKAANESVIDTTWGKDIPDDLDTMDVQTSRDIYQRQFAETLNKVPSRELMTVTSEKRLKRLRTALVERGTRTSLRLLKGISPEWALMDFGVIDSEYVLLARSHAHADATTEPVYYAIRDRSLGRLFTEFFNDCWEEAWDVCLRDNQIVASRRGFADEIVDANWSARAVSSAPSRG